MPQGIIRPLEKICQRVVKLLQARSVHLFTKNQYQKMMVTNFTTSTAN